jgi:hypothetical protein
VVPLDTSVLWASLLFALLSLRLCFTVLKSIHAPSESEMADIYCTILVTTTDPWRATFSQAQNAMAALFYVLGIVGEFFINFTKFACPKQW